MQTSPHDYDLLYWSGGNVVNSNQVLSAGTDLYNIFASEDGFVNFSLITSGGTDLYNIFAQENGNVDFNTILSAGTDLYSIFSTGVPTFVQDGTNTYTGGTDYSPTINLVDSPSINDLVASGTAAVNTLSAATILSAGTDLYNIFSTTGGGGGTATAVQPQQFLLLI